MKKEEFERLISRRSFLKGALATAVSAGVLGVAPAFAEGSNAENAAETAVQAGSAPGYELINTDLLILGAGNNAQTAAAAALAKGKNVTIVDKGLYRHSGTSGLSWDAFSNYVPPEANEAQIASMESMNINMKAFKNALEHDTEPNKFVYMCNHGQSLPDRNDDGTIKPYFLETMCMGQFCRREMDEFVGKSKAAVYDQTMITDLLINEGRCVGAVGLYIPTGTLRVFRAKATILATGGCTWIHGWLTVSAGTMGTPDNTADADMAAFRHGAGIGDAEFAQYDVIGVVPDGLGYGFGANICADAQEADAMVDKNGDPVFTPGDPNVGDRIYFCQELAKVISAEGRGTERGGVYVNIGDTPIRYANSRSLPLLEKFGFHPREEFHEVAPEMYEHGGNPIIDSKMMTEIPGLFCGRGGGTTGATGGGQVWFNRVYGNYAGMCAADYIDGAEPAGEMDWAPVYEEYLRLNEILNRKSEDGIRPHVIRHEIQRACAKALGIYRTTKDSEEAIAELQRIRNEEMPKMIVTDSSPIWNREWKEAIENYNMLDITEISIRASLMREETRGMYLRAEFPEKDDANWACTLVCYNRDGEMVFEKKTEWD